VRFNLSKCGQVVAAVGVVTMSVAGVSATPAGANVETPSAIEPSAIEPVRPCSSLTGEFDIGVTSTEVTSATEVRNTKEPDYCDVRGEVAPAVKFQLKLRISTFAGRYLQYGCQGLCGTIFPPAFPACGNPPSGDFAVAATDDGHMGQGGSILDGTWAANNQAARNDYFYRAPHVVSMAAKRVIARYYGSAPKSSYFEGCSTGGREALLLAQRYPEDFNGIVAGDPANYMGPLFGVNFTWMVRTNTDPNGAPILTADKLPALHNAVVAACDGLDGLIDGQIDDPRACHFDPASIQCPPGVDTSSCLTPAQVVASRRLYAGPTDSGGRRLYPGNEPYGAELAWYGSIIPIPGIGSVAPLPDNYLKYVGYPIGTPSSSVADFQFTAHEFQRLTAEGVKGNALSLDLTEFRRAGGKLIIWHGWADQSIPAVGTLDYYQRLWQHNGGLGETQEWARTFMVPTLYHCGFFGGYKLTDFDPFPALVSWVEHSHAPDRIIANGRDTKGNIVRTRPVFPYPFRAKYIGTGSIDDASNFVGAPPLTPPHDIIHWIGEDLYNKPGPVAP
jgi:feruloyl esterase